MHITSCFLLALVHTTYYILHTVPRDQQINSYSCRGNHLSGVCLVYMLYGVYTLQFSTSTSGKERNQAELVYYIQPILYPYISLKANESIWAARTCPGRRPRVAGIVSMLYRTRKGI